ncbi:cytochrome P450 [Micromonospora sp. NEAU-HG-1]|nr:cytochrome P450 [Micromonospora rubida]
MTSSVHEFDRYADIRATLMLPTDCGDESALEAAANRIGLLVQACDATGDLIDRARRAAEGRPGGHDIETLLVETLRHDPPVRATRRMAVRDTRVAGVDIAEGELVILDLATANRDPEVFTDPEAFDLERSGPPSPLTFGSPPTPMPSATTPSPEGHHDQLCGAAPHRYATTAPQRLGPRLGGSPRRAGLPGDRHDEPRRGRSRRPGRRCSSDLGRNPPPGPTARQGTVSALRGRRGRVQ